MGQVDGRTERADAVKTALKINDEVIEIEGEPWATVFAWEEHHGLSYVKVFWRGGSLTTGYMFTAEAVEFAAKINSQREKKGPTQ